MEWISYNFYERPQILYSCRHAHSKRHAKIETPDTYWKHDSLLLFNLKIQAKKRSVPAGRNIMFLMKVQPLIMTFVTVLKPIFLLQPHLLLYIYKIRILTYRDVKKPSYFQQFRQKQKKKKRIMEAWSDQFAWT